MRLRPHPIALCAAAVGAAVAVLPTAAAAPVSGAPIPLSDGRIADGVNGTGEVVGQRASRPVAVAWDGAGTPHDLAGLTPGGASRADAVDRGGEVAGVADAVCPAGGPAGLCPHAVVWDPTGAVTDLGVLPGGTSSEATALNDQGWVAGWSTGPPGRTLAVLWTPAPSGSTMTVLDAPADATGVRATGVNGDGQVVGEATGSDGLTHALNWPPGGRASRLPEPPGAVSSRAAAVNTNGGIAGTVTGADGVSRAALWVPTAFSGYTVQLLAGLPGGISSEADAITDRGLVAGASTTATGSVEAVVWAPAGSETPDAVTELSGLPGAGDGAGLAITGTGEVAGVSGDQAVHWDVAAPG